ncbi:MAG: hypothetical protein LC808_45085 [Actinobacteria bacterium]|nr:hypothetical protein [Actinomycetota bacterium]
MLGVQRLSHDPADGADALAAITDPVTTATGQRVPGMRFTAPRVQALLSALCVFRLLPRGFTNRDLRLHLAPQLGLAPQDMTSGQITYDLRRLRTHGLIQRIPRTHRYQLTNQGLRNALFLTRAHNRLLRTGLAQLHGPPTPSKLRAAEKAYETALTDLTRTAGLAA